MNLQAMHKFMTAVRRFRFRLRRQRMTTAEGMPLTTLESPTPRLSTEHTMPHSSRLDHGAEQASADTAQEEEHLSTALPNELLTINTPSSPLSTSDSQRPCALDALPNELKDHIISMCGKKDLLNLCKVSRNMCSLTVRHIYAYVGGGPYGTDATSFINSVLQSPTSDNHRHLGLVRAFAFPLGLLLKRSDDKKCALPSEGDMDKALERLVVHMKSLVEFRLDMSKDIIDRMVGSPKPVQWDEVVTDGI